MAVDKGDRDTDHYFTVPRRPTKRGPTMRIRRITVALAGIALLGGTALAVTPASATYCEDGTYSSSVGSGTCSWHGGVDEWTPGYTSPSDESTLDDYATDPYDDYATDPYDDYATDPYSSYSDPGLDSAYDSGFDSYSDTDAWGY